MSQARGRPISPDEAAQYERFRRMVKEKSYRVEISNEHFVRMIDALSDPIIRCLFPREWSVLVAGDGAGNFICSDHPISLVPVRTSSPFLGFGTRGTEVTLPLARQVAVVGRFEGEAKTETADAAKVAEINTQTAAMAGRYVYAPSPRFAFLLDAQIRKFTDLFSSLDRQSRRR